MIPLNYHHLYYFWVVARLGNISAAAKKLLLAQPTLSAQIKTLERRCGKQLLYREPGGIRLTSEGRIVLDYCERIFGPGQELAASIERGLEPAAPSLRIGVQQEISRRIVLQLVDFARRSNRKMRIRIFGGSLRDLRERLQRRALDIVVSNVDLAFQLGREFRGRLVGKIPLCFVATPAIAAKVDRFPRGLIRLPLLLRTPDNAIRKEVDRFLHRRKIAASIEAEIEDAELLRILALEGQGAAALELLAVRGDLRSGNLVPLHRYPIGIEERVWLTAGRKGPSHAELEKAWKGLMNRFSLKV